MKKPNAPNPWYNRQVWKGVNGVRRMKLSRDPICETLGCDRPATTVDHRRAFMTGRDDAERWLLFIGGTNLENLRSQCQAHHDMKTLAYEDGKVEFNPIAPTGAAGRQFASATVTQAQIDAALPQTKAELDDLLAGIPD